MVRAEFREIRPLNGILQNLTHPRTNYYLHLTTYRLHLTTYILASESSIIENESNFLLPTIGDSRAKQMNARMNQAR